MKLFPGRTEVALQLKYNRKAKEVREVFTPEIVSFLILLGSDGRMLH